MQYQGNKLRHEIKYYINDSVYHTLRNRLKTVLIPDENMVNEEGYLISSLYFDDVYQSAFEEKQSGSRFRKKYRIRSYNRSNQLLRLECKQKFDEYIAKGSADLSDMEYQEILKGNTMTLINRPEQVCRELMVYERTRLLRPVVVVEYQREAYVLPQGNVRITFDKDISASVGSLDLFAQDFITRKVLSDHIMVMEVKYDDFIPYYVQELLRTAMTDRCAISKYVMCRQELRKVAIR